MPRVTSAKLVTITIRLRAEDITRARQKAAEMAIPYQHVIRGWVAKGAQEQDADAE